MSTRYGVWEGEEPRTGPSADPPSTTCLIPAHLSCKPAGCSLQYLAEDFKTIVLVEQESVMKHKSDFGATMLGFYGKLLLV